jgi:deazaflavin-dependent oxidoreductase (nitroreductase family)
MTADGARESEGPESEAGAPRGPERPGDPEEIVDSPTDWVARHIHGYVESGGRDGHDFYGNDTLLLTTRGRRSGRLRRTALIYGRDGDDYVVVGSNGGSHRHPAWYLNLRDDPEVQVQVWGERFTARARPAAGADKARLWDRMVALFPTYAKYRRGTEREIPVVRITPTSAPD